METNEKEKILSLLRNMRDTINIISIDESFVNEEKVYKTDQAISGVLNIIEEIQDILEEE